jgi:hypothetical protein
MGVISKKLAARLRKAKKLLGDLRRQAVMDFSKIPRDLQGKVTLDTPGYDPLHAAYIAAQNALLGRSVQRAGAAVRRPSGSCKTSHGVSSLQR